MHGCAYSQFVPWVRVRGNMRGLHPTRRVGGVASEAGSVLAQQGTPLGCCRAHCAARRVSQTVSNGLRSASAIDRHDASRRSCPKWKVAPHMELAYGGSIEDGARTFF